MSELPFRLDSLTSYLADRLPGQWQHAVMRQFVGGQSNPTYLIHEGARAHVLRKQPTGELLPSAHAIDREYRVMSALGGTDVPVPPMEHFCADASVIGTPFFLMGFVEGRVLKDPMLPQSSVTERAAIHEAMNRTLASLHTVDYRGLGLGDYGRPGNYFARQIDRWTRQYRESATEPIPAMDELIARLPGEAPVDELSSLVHGDFRIENLIFHPTQPRVLAVLDWELSTLGHPLADLAYNCFSYHLPRSVFDGVSNVSLSGTGVPTEQAYVASYLTKTGFELQARWGFYMAFALFRLAAILQGVTRRALDGHASSPDSLQRGSHAATCAEAGLRALNQ